MTDDTSVAAERVDARRILDENPAFARVLRQFTALYDAAEVLGELRPPQHEIAAPWLREIADHVMRETGIGEDFLQALIRSRPPLGEPIEGEREDDGDSGK
jgi:hypothetical protein